MNIETVKLDALQDASVNANVMLPERLDILRRVIGERGFFQPILVRPLPGARYEIVDGHHRVRVLRELGKDAVEAVVRELTDEEAAALQLAMNRLRGEVDLAQAGGMLDTLHHAGWDLDALTMAGFTRDEVVDLLAAVNEATDVTEGVNFQNALETPTENTSPFILEIVFRSKEELALARRRLKKAAGKGRELADGLLSLLGEPGGEGED